MLSSPAGTRAGIVRVALPLAIPSLFDYEVPPELEAEAEPGRRVLVPFGSRRLAGVIVESGVTPAPRGRALRALERVLDAEPVLSADMLRMLREAADEVLCPLGLALAAALPPGSTPRGVTRYALTPRGREALRSGAVRGPARALLERVEGGPGSPAALARRVPRGAVLLRQLTREGLLTRSAHVGEPDARVPTERWAALAAGVDAEAALRDRLERAPRQAALLRQLARRGPTRTRELEQGGTGVAAALRALGARGLVEVGLRPTPPRAPDDGFQESEGPIELTPEQQQALDVVEAVMQSGRSETLLIHGVTGSGKTEIYLRAIATALRRGRQALVLVPEITLTHQIVARLRARFGDALAVLHSGLRPGERLAQWQRLREGRTPIAVGARSALFAPLEKLGVIVIDEEHDTAYKNEEGFRYHARDLAAKRARNAGCPLLLGSATPSLETRYAAETQQLRRLVLPHRIGGTPLPAVEIVDLVQERARAPRGRKLVLTRPLRLALERTLAQGDQAILFLNRRGFSTRVLCFDCGHAERCAHCDVSLVYHASEQRLRCHHCDYAVPPPDRCGGCGADSAALLGIGTQRVEEEVRGLFPEARVARLDRDVAVRRGAAEKVLLALKRRELDIVVGTQILAKGHDLPGVHLVGIIAADLALHHPDFRAAERTFQLLTQVAGRAGRRGQPGRVVVQTFSPEHYAIAPVREHDYEAFYRVEIAHRASLGYPPVGHLVHVLVTGPEAPVVEQTARRLAETLAPEAARAAPAFEVLGPAPAPLARLRDRFRFQLLVKGTDREAVARAARLLWRETLALRPPLEARVDVNPVNML